MTGLDLGVMEVVDSIPASDKVKPKFTHTEFAVYTDEAKIKGIKGTVVINAVFTADGKIKNIQILRGLPFGLTEEAVKALNRFKFKPAMIDGVAVSVRMSMEFTFNLIR